KVPVRTPPARAPVRLPGRAPVRHPGRAPVRHRRRRIRCKRTERQSRPLHEGQIRHRSGHRARERHRRRRAMNLTYTGLELRRVTRVFVTMFFVGVLPAFFYVIFGASMTYADQPVGHGNVAMYVMVSMAAYGAVTATTGV